MNLILIHHPKTKAENPFHIPLPISCSALFSSIEYARNHTTTGKTIVLTIWTFVGKVVSLLFNMLSRLVIAFLPRRNIF